MTKAQDSESKSGFRAKTQRREEVLQVHKKQLMTYLKLTGMKLGLLVNFNTNLIKDGIERVVNGL